MRFRDFLLKTLLADTDYLVGYDADGNYIRISKADLSAQLAGTVAQTITIQYSANGESWHNSYTAGDHYLRVKAGSGAWSDAIPLCVSAYDIWLAQGNNGTEEDFLRSLRGENGEADLSNLRLQDINGYAQMLSDFNLALQNAKNAIISDVVSQTTETMQTALDDKLDTDLSNLAMADYLNSEGKVLVIADGTPKVMSLNSFMACVSIMQESARTTVAAATASEKRIYIPVSWTAGVMTITASTAYKTGSTALFVNGVLLKNGTDYSETTPTTITLLSYTPKANDTIQLLAIPE